MDTRDLAARGRGVLAGEVASFVARSGVTPRLAMVSVSTDDSIAAYERTVAKAGASVGIAFEARALREDASESDLRALLADLNGDASVHGVSLQLPLPPLLPIENMAQHLHPDKDVEGYHPHNTLALSRDTPRLIPPPALGALQILEAFEINPSGMQAIVVGRSSIIGRPLAVLLQQAGASVAVAHRGTPNVQKLVGIADLLVLGASMPGVLEASMLKPGATVLDFGINYLRDGGAPRIVGNLDFETACEKVGAITPMPGGTGPMTTLSLLQNTLKAAQILSA